MQFAPLLTGPVCSILKVVRAVYLRLPKKLEIKEVPFPKPGEGEVILRIRASLTCGTDLKLYERGHPRIPLPTILGHEFSGEVCEIGPGVQDVRPGDRVVASPTAPCGRCPPCLSGRENLCQNLFEETAIGSFAEYLKIPSRIVLKNLFVIPDSLSFEEAAFLEPLSSVLHGYRKVNPQKDETLLIVGAGPMGLLFLSLARSRGIESVYISAKGDERKRLARDLGGEVLEPHELEEIFPRGLLPQIVIEATGRKEIWEIAPRIAGKGARLLLYGGLSLGAQVTLDATRLHYDELTLLGSFHYTREDVKEAMALISKKSLPLRSFISGEYPLSQVEEAFLKLKRGEGVKYVIRP